jgi:hypothetical protein
MWITSGKLSTSGDRHCVKMVVMFWERSRDDEAE